ncbi:nucleoside hydrolase [Allosalinactinospora lopnorensis]|uniref:nucleoside hydrolase n=1 Tax=Allosalinactinospora lopnorensis TaxID=1352348 RepID=UPI000623C0A3|nr:nucleoside hydrolase [Allosalinactinospora lopnorensis]
MDRAHGSPLVIDCDPGVDDAIALLMALAAPELDLRGLTTVAGNVSLPEVNRNAARVLDLAGAPDDLPLVSGLDGPIARTRRVRDEPVHGEGGLGGVHLPPSKRRFHDAHAVDWLAAQALAEPGTLTLAAIGPLSNVAMMVRRHPEAAAALREVVVMGGAAFVQGNTTPAAEFNFFADPEAARLVVESGPAVRIVGLDVTRAALFPPQAAERLASMSGAAGVAGRMLDDYGRRAQARSGLAGFPVHDALAVSAVSHPRLLGWEAGQATVECAGTITCGALVADLRSPGRPRNIRMACSVDAEGFAALLSERLSGYAR